MTYTTTIRDGKIEIPDTLLSEAGFAPDATVSIRKENGGLIIEPAGTTKTIAAAEEQFPDEWILMAVTDTDADGMAIGGQVVFHTPDYEAAVQAARQWIAANPDKPNAFFYSGDPEGAVIV